VQLGRVMPLSRYRIFESAAPDELKLFLAKKRLDLRINAKLDGGALDSRVNAAYLPGMYLSALAYEGLVAVAAPPDRLDYALQIPLAGALEAQTGAASVAISLGQAAVGSPGRDQVIRSTPDCMRMIVSLNRDTVVRQLAAMLGEAVVEPLVFETAMSLDNPHAAAISGLLRWAVGELERSPSLLHNPLAAMQLEQFMVTALLLAQDNNYRDRLQATADRGVSVRSVKRAIDYIQANAAAPLTLADLVAASGVAGRTLHKHFRLSKGMSPMAYLRGVRLQKAREDLLRDTGQSVTEIAARWGFDHLGRFAADYRKRFGETPSQTQRRRR
jgi:AraC-like DNA-binding protein